MRVAVAIYLAVGFLVGLGLVAWIAVSSVRRHGLRVAIRKAAQTYLDEVPLYWRLPVAAWTFILALPVIAVWEILRGVWDPVGAVFVALLWLLWFLLLRWHWRAKARATPRR